VEEAEPTFHTRMAFWHKTAHMAPRRSIRCLTRQQKPVGAGLF
jgi:hypothetical protein